MVRKKNLLVLVLFLISCSDQESDSFSKDNWSYREIFVDKPGSGLDHLYEFEIPLPKKSILEFPLSTRVKISTAEQTQFDDGQNFSLMISQSPHEIQGVIYDICSNGISGEVNVNLQIISEDENFKIYKIQPACNNSNGYIIEGESSVYNVWPLGPPQNFDNINYAITHIRKNPRAFPEEL